MVRDRLVLVLCALGLGLIAQPKNLSAACCPGDVDGNGVVQSADTLTFAGILLGVAGTPDQLCATDANIDGVRDGRDIGTFVAKVLAGEVCPAACCVGGGTCQSLTPNQCMIAGGCFQGIGTVCSPNPCACQVGRCDANGLCSDGCELIVNSNPGCNTNQFLGSVRGDTGADILNINGASEAWYRVQLAESNNASVYLSAAISLQSNTQSDFDLHVYCFNCAGGAVASSTAGTGQQDQILVRWNDDFGADDTASVIIEVRLFSGGCDGYSLNVIGNVLAQTELCDP